MADFGCGTGTDTAALRDAGFDVIGVDVALGNAALSLQAGVPAIEGSLDALPLRSHHFDAAYSFSTLMHLDEPHARVAVAEMHRAVRPGGTVVVGLWGAGSATLEIDDTKIPGHQRRFHLRTLQQNRAMVADRFDVTGEEVWDDIVDESWHYHLFWLRAAS